MPVGIGARPNCRMSSRRNQVRVVVVAVRKMSALLQEEIPPIFRIELSTISIQVVPAKLVKHQYHDKLRFRVICICPYSWTHDATTVNTASK